MRTGRPIPPLSVTEEQRGTLENWVRRPKTAQALALRAEIILACAGGKPNSVVAQQVKIRRQTVGKWRSRFRNQGLEGLLDGPRSGTPAFLAPELAMGHDGIDARADIYSLDRMAYWLLTGQVVFDEKTLAATAMAHVQKAPMPPSARTDRRIPPGLETIVLACLAKDPS